MKYFLFLALVLALGLLAAGHRQPVHGACVRPRAAATPVVVRKSAWAAGRPKSVRAVPPGPQPQP